jgi:predicted molibdopterin-dependent oxidoreductase YjgC
MSTTTAAPTRRQVLAVTGAAGVASVLLSGPSAEATPTAAAAEKAIPTFCAMCGPSAGCGILAIVRDGKFVGIESWPDAPLNHGKNCPKAHAAPQWVYSEQRLRYPLKRVGAKGEGRFQRTSWEEALDTIAAKLKEQKARYGPESLAILSPAHRTYSNYLYRFLTAHGSPNYGHSGICAVQKAFTFSYTLGAQPQPDIDRTNLLMIWGKQPVYAGSSKGSVKQLLDAKARGAKIISIKPTTEPDVALSDVWVPIRPGTDAALALAFLHVIVTERLYDAAFVEKWTFGFDKLVDHVQRHTPEWAEPITGVSAKQIRDVARLYATTKPACIDHGNGFEHAPGCNSAIRAVAILMAITGNLDKPGGDGPKLSASPGHVEILLKKMPASFSHVYAGKYAGVGTIGFSHNLINPQFGPRVRYVSVFTAAEIEGDPVIEKDLCKKCELCRRLCPVQALAASPGRLEANRGPGGLIHPASTQSAAPEQVYLQRGLPNSIGGSVVIGATHFGTTADGLVAADWATGKVLWQEASAGGPLPSLSAPARQPNPLLPRT